MVRAPWQGSQEAFRCRYRSWRSPRNRRLQGRHSFFRDTGFTAFVTSFLELSPHCHGDHYRNSPSTWMQRWKFKPGELLGWLPFAPRLQNLQGLAQWVLQSSAHAADPLRPTKPYHVTTMLKPEPEDLRLLGGLPKKSNRARRTDEQHHLDGQQ